MISNGCTINYMDAQHQAWNDRQKRLQGALVSPGEHTLALNLFLHQHALLHAREVSGISETTFNDQLGDGLDEATFRIIPPGEEHSIAWCLWHIARIEDICMNLLVAGQPQIFSEGGWQARLNLPFSDTGNAQPANDTARLSATINLSALRAYRKTVGKRTRDIVQSLSPAALREKVQSSRLERIWTDTAVLPEGHEVVEYWGSRTIAGLLLMPATRHPLVHLNEAMRIKQRIRRRDQ